MEYFNLLSIILIKFRVYVIFEIRSMPILTLRRSRTIIQVIPSAVSQSFVSPIFSNIFCQTSTNLLPVIWMPRMSFTWLVAMIIAAADVKPTETGPDMKSNRKPDERRYGRIY